MIQVKLHATGDDEEGTLQWANNNLCDAFLVRTRQGSIEGVGRSRKSIDKLLSSTKIIHVQESEDSGQLNYCCAQKTDVIMNTFMSDAEIEGRKHRYRNKCKDKTYDVLLAWAKSQAPTPTRKEIARKVAEILRQHKHYLVSSDITSIVDTCLYDIGHIDFLDSL